MMKIGIIRCRQTEDMCPGTADFKVASEGRMAFAETGPAEIVGFVSCGGCPGKRAVSRAMMMVERGAEAISLGLVYQPGKSRQLSLPSLRGDQEEHSRKDPARHKDN